MDPKESVVVSVVIPTFNRKDKIGDAVKSVLVQDVSGVEILVVDDGSTDGTKEYLENKSYPVKLISKMNGGVSSARNAGIKAAKGRLIAFLDSDDIWLEGMLSTQLEYLNNHPDISLVYTDQYINIDGKNLEQTRFQRNPPKNNLSLPAFVDYTPIHTSTVMVKKDVFDVVGLFDESLKVHEDSELWNRISDRYVLGFIEKPLSVYRWESKSEHITSQKNQVKFIENGKRYIELYRKNKKRPLTPEEEQACVESEKIIADLENKLLQSWNQ